MTLLTRRHALIGAAAGSGFLLAGCDKIFQSGPLTDSTGFQKVLGAAEGWTLNTQRFLLSGGAMAREFKASDITPKFKANGTLHPGGDEYAQALSDQFANWRLTVDGMVSHPLSLSVAQLRALPSRTQITRHDCVEGWSAIAQWTGVQLGMLLKAAGVAQGARYVVFHCADNLDGEPAKGGAQAPGQYYESIGMADAIHPQTIMAYAMNGRPLDVPHGAPVRLRVERQLGYKQAKYVKRIEVTNTIANLYKGKGGYWKTVGTNGTRGFKRGAPNGRITGFR